jgi:hypothetical protein
MLARPRGFEPLTFAFGGQRAPIGALGQITSLGHQSGVKLGRSFQRTAWSRCKQCWLRAPATNTLSYRSLIRGGEKGRKLPVDFDLNRPIGAGRADHDLFDQFPNGSVGFGSVVVVGQV